MFDDLNNKTKESVEDIFSASEKSVGGLPEKPTVFQPKKETAGGLPAPSGYAGASAEESASGMIGNVKKFLILGAIVLGLALVVYGGYWAYSNFGKGILIPAGDETGDKAESGAETSEQSGNAEEAAPVVEQMKDSDEDGLSDEEEKQLGTVPGAVDSDSDGLFDREEVKVYKTDPLKADTDGDGFSDGEEVKGGYNPNGSGKLYEIR